MTITWKSKPHQASYTLSGHTVKNVNQAKYLIINITINIDWKSHINNSVNKTDRILGFLKLNLKKALEEVLATKYKTMVWAQVQYCWAMWDAYTADLTRKVEIVQ